MNNYGLPLSSDSGVFVESLYGPEAFQGFAVEEVLFEGTSDFQEIGIYRTKRHGVVLVLDGIVQTTQEDEFIYHEMMTHVPLCSLDDPKRVMIVGGGDGGILREVLQHPIERCDMVEIDKLVVDTCVEHLPFINNGGKVYEDPRANLVIADAFQWLRDNSGSYDAIIVDSTDPVGAAEVLFTREFYQLCCDALTENGVVSLQDGVGYFQRKEVAQTLDHFRALGLATGCYISAIPTYYGGYMTFGFASKNPGVIPADLQDVRRRANARSLQTRHYNPEFHAASFVLPNWIRDLVNTES